MLFLICSFSPSWRGNTRGSYYIITKRKVNFFSITKAKNSPLPPSTRGEIRKTLLYEEEIRKTPPTRGGNKKNSPPRGGKSCKI
ncbi:MAG: hypothetical protein LBQ59_04380 [Candidatus Peribacteria bacterium]|jgi:hypothetical protein|nr:hypothetical protein [Candidatus Peribacteria bacterium]